MLRTVSCQQDYASGRLLSISSPSLCCKKWDCSRPCSRERCLRVIVSFEIFLSPPPHKVNGIGGLSWRCGFGRRANIRTELTYLSHSEHPTGDSRCKTLSQVCRTLSATRRIVQKPYVVQLGTCCLEPVPGTLLARWLFQPFDMLRRLGLHLLQKSWV